MTLTEMVAAIETEVQDASADLTTVTRAVVKTVSLMSRLLPKRNIGEYRIGGNVTGETLVIASSTGTLAVHPVDVGSVKITGEVEGTDFSVNHLTGVVTEIGSLLADGNYTVSYSRDPRAFDIAAQISNMVKMERVEYPAGQDPPVNPTFEHVGDFLFFKGKDFQLTEAYYLRATYLSAWTAPATAAGDYPVHLDNAVIVGSVGQYLIFMAEKYVKQAITEVELANAAYDSMATPLADINTALDKVNTYLVTNLTTDNAADVLSNVTDDIAELRTAVETALDKASTYVTNATTPPSAHDYLVDGDDYIATVNVANRVAEVYAEYARASLEIYASLINEANTRLSNLRSYIEESEEWRKIGETFVAEATQRFNEVNAWSIQAQGYIGTSQRYFDIAGRYLASGQAKINEFLMMLGIKPEFPTTKLLSEGVS